MISIGHYGFAFFIFLLASLLIILYNYLFSDMKRQKKLLDEKENKLLRLYQSVEEALDDFHDSVERSHGEITAQLKELGELHAEVERNMRGLAAHAPARIERHESPMARRTQAPAPQVPPSQTAAQQPAQQAMPAAFRPASAVSQAPARPAADSAATLADSIGQAAANIRATAPTPAAAPRPAAPATPTPAAPAPAAETAQAAPQQMAPPPVFRQVLEAVEQVEPPPAPPVPDRNEMILKLSREGRLRAQIAKELGITLSEVDLVIGMNK